MSRATRVNSLLAASLFLTSCLGKERDPSVTATAEFVNLPTGLEMRYGNKITIETKPEFSEIELNKSRIVELLSEKVTGLLPPINVRIYPTYSWIKYNHPNGLVELLTNDNYLLAPMDQKEEFADGRTITTYDGQGKPEGILIFIGAERYLYYSNQGGQMVIKNEYAPEGIIVNPEVAFNSNFYHELVGHALLRTADYRELHDEKDINKEESSAQKKQIEWINSLPDPNDPEPEDLFLIH